MESSEIIANHAHVFQKKVRVDGTVDELKRIMELCGITKAVAFAPFHAYFEGSEKENPNKWLQAHIQHDDSLFGFGVVDFTKPDLRSQVKEIRELGLHGIKLHPAFQRFKIDDERAFEVYAAAQEEKLPISFHTGIHWHRIRDYNMLLFDEVAYHFKDLKFSLEHVGGYSFFKDGVAVMSNNLKNVYAGLTSVFDREENKHWYLEDKQIEDLLWLTGCHRSIFGIDFPYNGADKIRYAIEKIRALSITEEEKQMILGENILHFLFD